MTSILLCSTPRSGSWLLAEGLESTGIAGHPREYFRADYEPIYREAWGLPAGADYASYLDSVRNHASTPDGTISIKFHWRQFTHFVAQASSIRRLNKLPQDNLVATVFGDPIYVFLRRGDKAAQAISLYRAMLSDSWWQFETSERRLHPCVESHVIDLSRVARIETDLANDEAAWLNYFTAFAIRPICLTYESLAQDYRTTISSLTAALHLRLPPAFSPAEPRLHKQADALSAGWLVEYRAWKEACVSRRRHAV